LLADVERTSEGKSVWIAAAETLGQFTPGVVPVLMSKLQGDDPQLRRAAAIALHGTGKQGQPAVGELIQLVAEDDSATRIPAIYGLMGIGPAAADSVPTLLEMLSHDDFHTQYWAIRAIGRIGLPAARPAVPRLLVLLRDGVASVRGNSALALGQLGSAAGSEIVPALEAALRDKTHSVRRRSATALGKLGSFAREAVPALEVMLEDPICAEQVEVAVSLWQITGDAERTLQVLVQAIQTKEHSLAAANTFGQLAEQAAPAVSQLVNLLDSQDAETRLLVIVALAEIGPSAKSAVPALKLRLEDPDEGVRETAAQAIEEMTSACL
jgi:HEAT repeat protein